ncbi:MAG: FAD-dependent oxidoreductase [Firmicutes bacterium]|nr:FAD-dependent oxidoreductase [Bacillota bacterium]
MDTKKIDSLAVLDEIKTAYRARMDSCRHTILICGGGGCVSSGCAQVRAAAEKVLADCGLSAEVCLQETGCMGACAAGPAMLILPERIFYTKLTPEAVGKIIPAHILRGQILEEYTFFDQSFHRRVPKIDDIDFFRRQVKIALRNCGAMDHSDIEAYIARDGYRALATALTMQKPANVIAEIKKSGLCGRGGAGFPTGVKWESTANSPGERKFMVCNADEGDPGAFMDRSIIEGDPHSVIEGMMLGGYATGAREGFVYIRAEYPLAIARLTNAIAQARERGLLGEHIFGTDFSFALEIRIGAGAFVCGEETALMNSIQGQRGEPRQKPPFPSQSGIFGLPTTINNVETYANVPAILLKGADWYAGFGSEKSKGTKVFALAGDIANTGLVEVPIGMPLGDILFDIGGGIPGDKAFKAAQIGGPAGGCISRENLNTPTDYGSLQALGAIMGSGGLIVMNEDACMVDTARFFMDFIRDESCGQCVACRIGTKRMLEILERITKGEGQEGDIELLEELGHTIQDTAMCGLGQAAPNPVLSAIANFRQEFEEHIKYKRCSAGVCSDLFISPCENTCPANINVPGYNALIAQGRFLDAYHLIRQENPFPSVCGRICTRPCESKCRRRGLDEAVAICDLKRFVADYARKHEQESSKDVVFPKNGKRVSVIGAGASGLTCAHYLTRIGYDVDVYEAEELAGGVLAFGIPEYRLPMDTLQYEIGLIEREGVRIHLHTEVGKDVTFDRLKAESDAVYVANGTQFPQKIDIPGEDLPGVIHGINFLKTVSFGRDLPKAETAVVIGGGNTAIDSARTALRLGAKRVKILYRRTRSAMPAYDIEINEALEEGVELMELVQPVRILAGANGRVEKIECVRMKLGAFDAGGRRKSVPIEGSNFFVEADLVIPAVSQHADLPFIPAENIGLTPWGTFTVNSDTMMTTMPGVFAGGDVVRGPDTVIQAIADGKKAAIAIDRYCGGRGVLNRGAEIEWSYIPDDDEVTELPRYPLEMLPLEKRKSSFDEVVLGYHKLTAMAEAMRCLHCERR